MCGKLSKLHCNASLVFNCGEKVIKWRKLWDKSVPLFSLLFKNFQRIAEPRNIKMWFWEFSTHGDISFVCGKLSELHFYTQLSPNLGDCSIMWKNAMDPGPESATYGCLFHIFRPRFVGQQLEKSPWPRTEPVSDMSVLFRPFLQISVQPCHLRQE